MASKRCGRTRRALNCHYGTPVVVGEQLYGFDGRQEEGGKLRCIDWKTGKVRWTEDDFGCGSLLAVGDKLIVVGENGDLALVKAEPTKYTELARRRGALAKPVMAPPALANGRLYARDRERLVCWKVGKAAR